MTKRDYEIKIRRRSESYYPAVYYNISKKMRTVYIKEAILRMLKSWSALLCQLNQSRYVACTVHK